VENRGTNGGTMGVCFLLGMEIVETCPFSFLVVTATVESDFVSTDTSRGDGLVGAQLQVVTGIVMDKAGGVAFMMNVIP
jgi:hypothetical protein